jgi:pyruvate-formate lyase-activating enzyme
MQKNNNINAVYCKYKFTYLKIDVEKRLLYNCHKAYPHQIRSQWLSDNPGKIFNTDIMLREREQMLNGKKNSSCAYACYRNEDQGSPSERQLVMKDIDVIDYENPYSDVETLDLMLGTDCNLTCLYCSGMFSSAWRREVDKNGTYAGMEKNWNDVYDRVPQKRKKETPFFKLILQEIPLMKKLRTMSFSGGEPFLYNYLDEFIKIACRKGVNLRICTGLGVEEKRFRDVCKKIKKNQTDNRKVTILVSAEGTGKNYELVRQNNSKRVNEYINIIKENNIDLEFICTVSNLGLFGLREFYDMYNHQHILGYNPVTHPFFLKKYIIDEKSKDSIKKQWQTNNDQFSKLVLQGLDQHPSLEEKQHLKTYLQQLKKNKKVNLDCLPLSFLSWLD